MNLLGKFSRNVMYVLLAFNLIPLVAVATELAEETRAIQYWSNTGLNVSYLRTFISEKSCHSELNKFIACIESLSFEIAAGYSLKRGDAAQTVTELLTESEINQRSFEQKGLEIKSILKDFGALKLVELKLINKTNTVKSNPKEFSKKRNKQQLIARKESLSALFGSSKGIDVSFDSLLKYGAELIRGHRKEALIVGQVINTYLTVAVDPHTHLNPIAQIQDDNKSSDEKFEGIGAQLRIESNRAVIFNPELNGPALAAGIKAGDIIIKVNGKSTKGMGLNELISLIRGPEGTVVTLNILRGNKESVFKIVRAKIETKNVSFRILTDFGVANAVGYIKIRSFSDGSTCENTLKALVTSFEARIPRIILDLRGNPGGNLGQAVCIGALFLGSRSNIVGVKDLTKTDAEPIEPITMAEYMSADAQLPGLPTEASVTTLIDSGSASASEIVAGALQDHWRSWIVGQRSFGKATVQRGQEWKENSKLFLFETVQRFYQPSGRTNQVVGIQPDFEVVSDPNSDQAERQDLREEDLFTNALPPLSEPWQQMRAHDVSVIEECLKMGNLTQKAFEDGIDAAIRSDYQLLKAQEITLCDAINSELLGHMSPNW